MNMPVRAPDPGIVENQYLYRYKWSAVISLALRRPGFRPIQGSPGLVARRTQQGTSGLDCLFDRFARALRCMSTFLHC